MAFKAKDLHYEKQEPAFLRKLRGQYSGDRQNVSVARPSKPRLDFGEDDGPTIIDEGGDSVSKEDYEAMLKGKEVEQHPDGVEKEGSLSSQPDDRGSNEVVAKDKTRKQEKLAGIGASNKRKQARVIGDEQEDVPSIGPEITKKDSQKSGSEKKAKKKKVKLSFDHEGD